MSHDVQFPQVGARASCSGCFIPPKQRWLPAQSRHTRHIGGWVLETVMNQKRFNFSFILTTSSSWCVGNNMPLKNLRKATNTNTILRKMCLWTKCLVISGGLMTPGAAFWSKNQQPQPSGATHLSLIAIRTAQDLWFPPTDHYCCQKGICENAHNINTNYKWKLVLSLRWVRNQQCRISSTHSRSFIHPSPLHLVTGLAASLRAHWHAQPTSMLTQLRLPSKSPHPPVLTSWL